MAYSVNIAGASHVESSLLERAIETYRSVLEGRLGNAASVAACARAFATTTIGFHMPRSQLDAATAFMFAAEEAEDAALAELGDSPTTRFEVCAP